MRQFCATVTSPVIKASICGSAVITGQRYNCYNGLTLTALDKQPEGAYTFIMMIEQTVEVPVSHRLTIDVPREIPAGPTILAFRPMTVQKLDKAKPKHETPITDRLAGCLAGIGDINIEEIREERLAKYLK